MVRGYQDESLGSVRTESPTASKRARQLFCIKLAQQKWRCYKADARAALSQGDLADAAEPVFCEPIPELKTALKMTDDEVLLLLKSV